MARPRIASLFLVNSDCFLFLWILTTFCTRQGYCRWSCHLQTQCSYIIEANVVHTDIQWYARTHIHYPHTVHGAILFGRHQCTQRAVNNTIHREKFTEIKLFNKITWFFESCCQPEVLQQQGRNESQYCQHCISFVVAVASLDCLECCRAFGWRRCQLEEQL